MPKGSSRLTGIGYEGIPSPSEKSRTNPGGKISESRASGAVAKTNPFSASYDNQPKPGDMKKGATRTGSRK